MPLFSPFLASPRLASHTYYAAFSSTPATCVPYVPSEALRRFPAFIGFSFSAGFVARRGWLYRRQDRIQRALYLSSSVILCA